jgi:hypothetical protein
MNAIVALAVAGACFWRLRKSDRDAGELQRTAASPLVLARKRIPASDLLRPAVGEEQDGARWVGQPRSCGGAGISRVLTAGPCSFGMTLSGSKARMAASWNTAYEKHASRDSGVLVVVGLDSLLGRR